MSAALMRYNPWSLLRDIQGDLSDVATSQWIPQVDIKEEKDRFLILVDLPGVDPKEIKVSMDNNVLTIKGDRKTESKTEDKNYSRVERFSGSFYRRFTLPDNVDGHKIEAKGKHGVLEVSIPKKEPTKPKEIEVKVKED